VSGVYIEQAANGAATIQTLQQRIAGIVAVSQTKSKWDRAFAASDELYAGNWYLPHPQVAPWVDEFLFEVSSFPRGKHDDWVDAWSQGANQLTSVADYSMFDHRVDVFAGLPPGYRYGW
jgi:predicted phage terminase large subunit-like protein